MNNITIIELGPGNPAASYVFVLVLVINLSLTLSHCILELKGYLWRYFGAIAGFKIPDSYGFFIFFVLLLLGLWGAGFFGIANPLFGFPDPEVATALVALIVGGRVSDSIYSHIRLHRKGYRPNPALATVPLYLIEAVFLTVLFAPGIAANPGWAIPGFAVGWLVFYGVFPTIRWFKKKFPSLSIDPWQAWNPAPEWIRRVKSAS